MNILLPPKLETASVRRGRAIIVQVMERVLELHDKGKTPTRIVISTALQDDLRSFFDYAYDQFDGVLPARLSGVPLAYMPGASRHVQIECGGPS